MLSSFLLYMEKYMYKIVAWPTMYTKYNLNFATTLMWSVVLSLKLVCTVEPFHRTQAQMLRTNTLVNTLKCRQWEDEAVSNELDTFVRLLMLRRPSYAPLSMLMLERALVVKIYGCLVTYLVIMLTYGPEVQQ
ncbi:uncharacterized protein LOC112047722 [Bicyclus anynana]|uniref:Uncharacterized protein LOC112047722 n=1 Tax=Bicyclus anynana TaxID=110368 RepID=A0A6J1N1G8_BICAN|nr:uncharacterized protein LOC112047722 [Bicyclus anynana]